VEDSVVARSDIPSPVMSSDEDIGRDDEYEDAGFDDDEEMVYGGKFFVVIANDARNGLFRGGTVEG
jgi:hypothetical protein